MNHDEEGSHGADGAAWRGHGSRDTTTTYRRSTGLAVLVTAAAIALAACGGSSTPQVASLGNSRDSSSSSGNSTANGSDRSSTTTPPKGNATALLDRWATCMHSHGDPNQDDPVIGSDKTIQIHIPQDAQSLSDAVHNGSGPCNQYLTATQRALRNGQPFPQPPSLVTEVKFAECIRANGVPNYPNPSGPNGSETNFNGTGLDPNSPQVQNAQKYCTMKLDIHFVSDSALGIAGDIQVSSGGPNGGPPPNPGPNRPRPAPGNGGAGAGSGASAGG